MMADVLPSNIDGTLVDAMHCMPRRGAGRLSILASISTIAAGKEVLRLAKEQLETSSFRNACHYPCYTFFAI
jgi:hypothetical protein